MVVGISTAGPSRRLIVDVPLNVVELLSAFCVAFITTKSVKVWVCLAVPSGFIISIAALKTPEERLPSETFSLVLLTVSFDKIDLQVPDSTQSTLPVSFEVTPTRGPKTYL